MVSNDFKSSLNETFCCPLCGSENRSSHSHPKKNLYSEKISGLLEADEQELLSVLENLICNECGLIYKKNWFKPEVLKKLFNESVPLHPRGWDTLSGRFNSQTFYKELDLFALALNKRDVENVSRYKRALTSIIDSIQDKDLCFDRSDAFRHISNGDLDYFYINKKDVEISFGSPEQFKRFSGYESIDLWQYLNDRVKNIVNYAEIGCPLWGMLRLSSSMGISTSYISKQENNFWTDKCKSDGTTCVEKSLAISPKISKRMWNDLLADKVDVLGVFQYIDHLEDPRGFFDEVFQRSPALLIVIEGALISPTYIQHFSGWTEQPMRYVAKLYAKKVDTSFNATQQAGHFTFLLY